MMEGILTKDIINTVLDKDILLAKAGTKVNILDCNGSYYEVSIYDSNTPTTTFYVNADQLRIIND